MEIKLTDENFKKEVLESELPCLVDFWASWCMPCLMTAPVIEEIAKEYDGKIKVCKLNVDEGPSTASQYQVMSIPTMMIFKDGKVIDKTVGALPKEKLEKFINPHIKG